jgi:hypothetical protein
MTVCQTNRHRGLALLVRSYEKGRNMTHCHISPILRC